MHYIPLLAAACRVSAVISQKYNSNFHWHKKYQWMQSRSPILQETPTAHDFPVKRNTPSPDVGVPSLQTVQNRLWAADFLTFTESCESTVCPFRDMKYLLICFLLRGVSKVNPRTKLVVFSFRSKASVRPGEDGSRVQGLQQVLFKSHAPSLIFFFHKCREVTEVQIFKNIRVPVSLVL